MAESLATTKDVKRHLHRALTPDEETDAAELLQSAWFRLIVLSPGFRQRIDAGALDPELVSDIQGEMVAMVLKNKEGARSTTKTFSVDDYDETETKTIDNALASGQLYPTDLHLKLLRAPRRGAWTTRPAS